jgi:hypothetical protein
MENLSELDIAVEDNQEKILRQYYNNLKWPLDKIDSKIQKLKNSMDLEEEAQTAYERLLEEEQEKFETLQATKKQQEQTRIAAQTKTKETLNKSLNAAITAKQIAGIPVDIAVAKELLSDLTQEKYHIPATGEKLTEFDKTILELKKPENAELKLKLYLLYKTLLKDPELSTVKKAGTSETTSKAFKRFATKEKVEDRTKTVNKTQGFEKGL